MNKAVVVNEDTIDYVVAYGYMMDQNLEDLRDTWEFNLEDGEETYCMVSGIGGPMNSVTFTDHTATDFRNTWMFPDGETYLFMRIERK